MIYDMIYYIWYHPLLNRVNDILKHLSIDVVHIIFFFFYWNSSLNVIFFYWNTILIWCHPKLNRVIWYIETSVYDIWYMIWYIIPFTVEQRDMIYLSDMCIRSEPPNLYIMEFYCNFLTVGWLRESLLYLINMCHIPFFLEIWHFYVSYLEKNPVI